MCKWRYGIGVDKNDLYSENQTKYGKVRNNFIKFKVYKKKMCVKFRKYYMF